MSHTRILKGLILSAALLAGFAAHAADPAHVGKYITTPQDIAAITKVTVDYRTAIKTKNPALLSSLLISPTIMFSSPPQPDIIRAVREESDPDFTGIGEGDFTDFANLLRAEKGAVEERFYNMRITQDGNIAVVMVDFDYVSGKVIENHGLEVWQMFKNQDGEWKIASLFYSSKGTPK